MPSSLSSPLDEHASSSTHFLSATNTRCRSYAFFWPRALSAGAPACCALRNAIYLSLALALTRHVFGRYIPIAEPAARPTSVSPAISCLCAFPDAGRRSARLDRRCRRPKNLTDQSQIGQQRGHQCWRRLKHPSIRRLSISGASDAVRWLLPRREILAGGDPLRACWYGSSSFAAYSSAIHSRRSTRVCALFGLKSGKAFLMCSRRRAGEVIKSLSVIVGESVWVVGRCRAQQCSEPRTPPFRFSFPEAFTSWDSSPSRRPVAR